MSSHDEPAVGEDRHVLDVAHLQIEQARHARLAEKSEKQRRKDVEAAAREILARHGLALDPATRRLGITIDADTLAEVLSFYDGKET
jgi:hypothetical protein